MCEYVWKEADVWKHGNEKVLDQRVCRLWARYAQDFDRGQIRSCPDMSYVNDVVEDGGCRGYK